ncbi:MAG: MFS transporter [Alphaproteobacteria bacterium]|nr:MAG: MFS transporter [Alphaproteobacteria bacterium]
MASNSPELHTWRLAIYGLPAVPLAFLFVPLTALLPAFYAQELGVDLRVVGVFLLVSRLFDIFIDPILGRWSDNTQSRFGRRRPWMVIGTPILMLGAWLVFMPPDGAAGAHLLIATSVIYLGASILGLAYSAWGAEIVESYHGRSKVAGFREAANVLGIVIASAVPAITALSGHGVDRFTMSVMGWSVIIMTPLAVLASLLWVPEPRQQRQPVTPWLTTLRTVLANRPFVLLCIAYFVMNIGASVTNSTLIFFISHYLGQPEVIGPVLLGSFGAVLLGVPFWVWMSRRIGKHRAAGYSLLIAICLSVLVATQLQPGDGWLFVALMAVLGAISAAYLTLPLGIVGDIIDYDTLRTGESRGGLYFGVWSFFQNVSPALAIGVTLPVLHAFGFDASGENSPQALQALKYIYCLAPAPLFLVGALMLLRFPLDARRHGIIRRRLESRRKTIADPIDAPHPPPAPSANPEPAS